MSRVSLALAAVASILAGSSALAADMYGNPPPAAYGGGYSGGSTSNWNGAYVGLQAGHGWGANDLNGGNFGAYAGVNATVGSNFVAGVEGDINVSGQNSSRMLGPTYYKTDSQWNGSIRARGGVAFDKVMPYATGGVAFADDSIKTIGASSTKSKVGYVAGGGVEAQMTNNISVKGELLHYGFGRSTHAMPAGNVSTTANSNVLRGGVAYRF